jgi:hypothetical protein
VLLLTTVLLASDSADSALDSLLAIVYGALNSLPERVVALDRLLAKEALPDDTESVDFDSFESLPPEETDRADEYLERPLKTEHALERLLERVSFDLQLRNDRFREMLGAVFDRLLGIGIDASSDMSDGDEGSTSLSLRSVPA